MANSESRYWFLVPGDPEQRTGGYGYVREVVNGLRHLGREVSLQGLDGQFPKVDDVARAALDSALASIPDRGTVVVDGLALCGCPDVAGAHSARINLVALVHHPLADETGLSSADRAHFMDTERRTLAAVPRVITTSESTASGLGRFGVSPEKVQVVLPGVHWPSRTFQSEHAPTTSVGVVRLLCVAHLSPRKAQLDLVKALAGLNDDNWTCQMVGSLDRDPAYARRVQARVESLGLARQILLTGELSGPDLEQAFGQADLFVLPSRYEGYGMVIDEALAHRLPVIASDGGALASTASRAGCVTYAAGNTHALNGLIKERLRDRSLLERQQAAARDSASTLRSWEQCAVAFHRALQVADRAALPEGSGFAEQWLRLREPADHQARDRRLCAKAADWLGSQASSQLVVADIGTGLGSNWRYLRRLFPVEVVERCHWHLYDQDRDLLNSVTPDDSCTTRHPVRLEAGELDRQLPAPLHLLTASALIDLVSRPWLEAMARAAAARSATILVVLSYAGRFRLSPGHPFDDTLRALVNDHQHGDKGTGAACGPEASDVLADALRCDGYQVQLAPSVWRLGEDHQALQVALMEGWVESARSQLSVDANNNAGSRVRLDEWCSTRIEQALAGELTIEVDHTDLYGAPGA